MILTNNIIVYDYESTSADPYTTQPIQLAAIAIHSRKLEVIEGSEFESLIKPIECEKTQASLGLGVIEAKALEVNKKEMADLRNAPDINVVWKQFTEYVNNFNYNKNEWSAPIPGGYNINNFDTIITNRICNKGLGCWGLGPVNEKRNCNNLFNPARKFDLLELMPWWFSSCAEPKNFKLTSIMEFIGMDTTNAHDALVDVRNTANLICRFLKLHKELCSRITWNAR